MRPERATTLLTVILVLLASGPAAGEQRDTTSQTRVLQGCVEQAGPADSQSTGRTGLTTSQAGRGSPSRGEDPSAAPTGDPGPIFWLETALDAGEPDDRSVHSGGQSGQAVARQQTPTGQQTQAGQEPMAAVMDEDDAPASRPTRYRLVTPDERVVLSTHVGQRVEVEGTVSSGIPAHRRHDGRPEPQGVGAPMTGLPGPLHQAGQPGPHYTSPDDDRTVAGTLTVTSVRVVGASCTTER